MEYISVKVWAEMHGVSERTARNYCAQGKIEGAYLVGKTWNIPEDAMPPKRSNKSVISPLLKAIRDQKERKTKGGIYHRIPVSYKHIRAHEPPEHIGLRLLE
ncbi:MAG: hypothetical protein K2I25_04185 [Muribaculaceae bacterium]|nr:hypothetical protein [Muribaculaceae bacterium]